MGAGYENSIEFLETSLVVAGPPTVLHVPSFLIKKSHCGITVLGAARDQLQINLQFSLDPDFPAHRTFTVETTPYDMLRIGSLVGATIPDRKSSTRRAWEFYCREDPTTTDNTSKTINIMQWD